MEETEEMEELKKITDYLVYRISRHAPFIKEVYDQMRLSKEHPRATEYLDDGKYYYCTNGTVLFVNPQLKEVYEEKKTEVELELFHELLHIYMGHPTFALEAYAVEYDQNCDVEVNEWIRKLYPEEKTKEYPIDKEKTVDKIWKHFPWYPESPDADSEGYKDGAAISLSAWEGGEEQRTSVSEKGKKCTGSSLGNEPKYLESLSEKDTASYIDIMKQYVYTKEKTCRTDTELNMILYSYGFELYKDITFVEPPEIIEANVIKCYIAIDTSASCDEEKVRDFLGHTKSVIQELSNNGEDELDIYLFLADDEIEQEFHICEMSDFPDVSDLIISGGGTDFRPVMSRVAELEKADRTCTGALFYYTDGEGRFPKKMPEFETWLLMDEEDIENLDSFRLQGDVDDVRPQWARIIKI